MADNMVMLSTYIELMEALNNGLTDEQRKLYERNMLLVEVANGFHEELGKLRYDLGGSLADEVEDALVRVLNGYAHIDKVKWFGLGNGYGLEWED